MVLLEVASYLEFDTHIIRILLAVDTHNMMLLEVDNNPIFNVYRVQVYSAVGRYTGYRQPYRKKGVLNVLFYVSLLPMIHIIFRI